jgi:flagellar operon protein (TIGR03826 family)
MDFVNCPRCGRLFQSMGSSICKECEKEEEMAFDELKHYLDENPNCSLAQLAEHTGISPKRIMRFIRQGRIEISSGTNIEVTCEVCGTRIRTGRYCDSCFIKVSQEIESMRPDTPKDDDDRKGPRMHTAGNIGGKKRL